MPGGAAELKATNFYSTENTNNVNFFFLTFDSEWLLGGKSTFNEMSHVFFSSFFLASAAEKKERRS